MDPTEIKQMARNRVNESRFAEAREILVDLCERVPHDAEAWFLLGAVEGSLGDFDAAVSASRRATVLSPSLFEAHLNLAVGLQSAGRWKECVMAARAVLRIQPDHAGAMEMFQHAARRMEVDHARTLCLRGGVSIRVPDSIHLMTPYILLEQEDWFEDEIDFVRAYLGAGMRAVDVGANHGVYTLAMAQRVGDTGSVFAFEPTRRTFDFLSESVALNGFRNTHCLALGLSDRFGEARFVTYPNSELNRVVRDATVASETVRLETLDDCAKQYGWSDMDFLKLDAEGEESRIIVGAADFLSRESPLIMFELKHGKTINTALIDQLRAAGYATYRMVRGLGVLVAFEPRDAIDPYQLNLFACKADRAAAIHSRGLLASVIPDTDVSASANANSFLAQRVYARDLAASWAEARRGMGRPSDPYYDGLSHYIHAHDQTLPASNRVAHLYTAYRAVETAMATAPSPTRWMTFARLASEIGQRARSVDVLAKLVLHAGSIHADILRKEPFLCPSPVFESHPVHEDPRRWWLAAVLESWEKQQSYSSYFSGTGGLTRLEQFRAQGYADAEMERRRQLVRLRHGLQDCVDPVPIPASASLDNLNPAYWLGT